MADFAIRACCNRFGNCQACSGGIDCCDEFEDFDYHVDGGCFPGACDDVPVSCCYENGNCETVPASECNFPDEPHFPAGCGPDIPCVADTLGCCCDPLGVTHEDVTLDECNAIEGAFSLNVPCEEIFCDQDLEPSQIGCRAANDPRYFPGDQGYSPDECATVALVLTKPPEGHNPPEQKAGRARLVTAAPCRATPPPTNTNPCRDHYGDHVLDENGRVACYFCSQPENASTSARFNRGVLTKQVGEDPTGLLKAGRVYFAVGIANPRTYAIHLHHNQMLCGEPV